MNTAPHIESFHAIIPAGGAGTRLWPLSRATKPKFLLDLTGTGRSLIQQTWDRLEPLIGAANIHVVTGPAHAEAIAAQLPELAHLIVEPSPRDSMPAIGLAAALIELEFPGAIVGSFAADHVITDTAQFAGDVAQAVEVARSGKVCTIGITPTEPSTAFGYIEAGTGLSVDGAPDAVGVSRFVEKPDAEAAARYVDSGGFAWNAGMFVTSAEVLLGHLAELRPSLYEGLTAIAHAWDKGDRQSVLDERWPMLERIAIDHAIAEPVAKLGGVAMVPGRFDWSDLGDFGSLSELSKTASDALFLDADGLVIAPDGKAVSVIGIPDAVVVDTGDALLVTTREHAQRVKELPGAWKARGREDLL
ncbi:MAG: sugar phosphate nucleotidyltransferase [Actinomycetota bacterium]|nr:sugar phosphate nucleotidyltransferase [Actinomycetota bacterium]